MNLEQKELVKEDLGLADDTIIEYFSKKHTFIGGCTIAREKLYRLDGSKSTNITLTTQHKNYHLLERIYGRNDSELWRYGFVEQYTPVIPEIYHIDFDRKILLLDNLGEDYIGGYDFDEENENGQIIRANYPAILKATAEFHAAFWENSDAFEKLGTDWRLQSRENILTHISGMENDFKKY